MMWDLLIRMVGSGQQEHDWYHPRAGITNPILVDAGGYGQKPETIINKGKEVADSDN